MFKLLASKQPSRFYCYDKTRAWICYYDSDT